MFLSAVRVTPGIRMPAFKAEAYDRVVLCGPIWMGMLISPLRAFMMKYRKDLRRLYFATCCGSGDDARKTSFGYDRVFGYVRSLIGERAVLCEAFPVTLVHSGGKASGNDAAMKTRISDENFRGEIRKRFDLFISRVKA